VEAAALHLRTRTYLVLVLVSAAIAVAIAFATLAFLGAYGLLKDALWEELPDALGVDPHPWYALAVTTLGGLVVGLLLVVVPGHGGPGPAEGHGIGAESGSPSVAAGMVLVSLVSLAVGASLGRRLRS
jgi:chloride channel protein, CIC family